MQRDYKSLCLKLSKKNGKLLVLKVKKMKKKTLKELIDGFIEQRTVKYNNRDLLLNTIMPVKYVIELLKENRN